MSVAYAMSFDGLPVVHYMGPDPHEGWPRWPRPARTDTKIDFAITRADDPFDFLRPLLAHGLDAQDACLLYSRCGKDVDLALLLCLLAKLTDGDPLKLAESRKQLDAAFRAVRGRL